MSISISVNGIALKDTNLILIVQQSQKKNERKHINSNLNNNLFDIIN